MAGSGMIQIKSGTGLSSGRGSGLFPLPHIEKTVQVTVPAV